MPTRRRARNVRREGSLSLVAGPRNFASGSPFHPSRSRARALRPARVNNVYIFPAMGHGDLRHRSQARN
ncbi:MAG: malic enzyme-like NAD(P)-binding protein [Methylovirgula sp.]